jgi:hypothetical protein
MQQWRHSTYRAIHGDTLLIANVRQTRYQLVWIWRLHSTRAVKDMVRPCTAQWIFCLFDVKKHHLFFQTRTYDAGVNHFHMHVSSLHQPALTACNRAHSRASHLKLFELV